MRNDAGYTLLEALVAFAVLSVVLVALYQAGGTSLRGLDADARWQDAALLARSKLDEIAAERNPLPKEGDGTFSDGDTAWHLTATDIPDRKQRYSAVRLQQVTLTLSWGEGLAARSLSVETRHLGFVGP